MYATLNPDGSADIYAERGTPAPVLTLPPAVVRAIQAAAPRSPRPTYTPTPDAADYPEEARP